jgi:LysR family cys regulon transcriptional activator
MAQMAYSPEQDADLVSLDASHLFAHSTTMIGCRKGTFLRGYMYDFIELFAPHLNRELVTEVFTLQTRAELDELFTDLTLPLH